jgi:hypothetical protein
MDYQQAVVLVVVLAVAPEWGTVSLLERARHI